MSSRTRSEQVKSQSEHRFSFWKQLSSQTGRSSLQLCWWAPTLATSSSQGGLYWERAEVSLLSSRRPFWLQRSVSSPPAPPLVSASTGVTGRANINHGWKPSRRRLAPASSQSEPGDHQVTAPGPTPRWAAGQQHSGLIPPPPLDEGRSRGICAFERLESR